jgi:phage tail sheath gpL-like
MNGTEVLALAVWYAFIALGIVFLYLIATMVAGGAELAITGSTTGTGIHNLTISGDWINATLSQAGNASTWNIQAGELA